MHVIDDEDQILVDALGAVGAGGGGNGGRPGARFAAKRLKKNIHQVNVTLAMPEVAAAERVAGILAQAGDLLNSEKSHSERVVRAIVGGGFGNMNPVLITVVLTGDGPDQTILTVRGAAQEGLIKQRAGEKTAKRIAELLTEQGTPS